MFPLATTMGYIYIGRRPNPTRPDSQESNREAPIQIQAARLKIRRTKYPRVDRKNLRLRLDLSPTASRRPRIPKARKRETSVRFLAQRLYLTESPRSASRAHRRWVDACGGNRFAGLRYYGPSSGLAFYVGSALLRAKGLWRKPGNSD